MKTTENMEVSYPIVSEILKSNSSKKLQLIYALAEIQLRALGLPVRNNQDINLLLDMYKNGYLESLNNRSV